MKDIIEISENFKIAGKPIHAELHHSGHIHSTYLVVTEERKYILQQVNSFVFPQPDRLADNILRVTEHICSRADAMGRDPSRAALTMISTLGGGYHFQHQDGSLWRMFAFIDRTVTYLAAQNPAQVFQAGLAIGDFISLLSDFPAGQLYETIRDFHNTPSRYASFLKALSADSFNRAKQALPEIDFVHSRKSQISLVVDMLAAKALPLRVTHNDTKISNVLFDQDSGEAVCLIDLDTVMPGTSLYDFGDAARTMTNTTTEDQPDIDLVDFNSLYFYQLAKGFIRGATSVLTKQELELLPFSAILMTLECGIRFLEDYLRGDVYFRTSRPQQNLDRARVQFRLVERMEENLGAMEQAVHSIWGEETTS